MQRFYTKTSLMLLSVTVLIASNFYKSQIAASPSLTFSAVVIPSACASSLLPIADMLERYVGFVTETTQGAAVQVGATYEDIRDYIEASVMSMDGMHSMFISG